MKAWLTRESEVYWTLSRQKPIVARMEGTGEDRIYPQPGDSLWYRFICRFLASSLFSGASGMAVNQSVPIEATIKGELRLE